MGRFDHLEMGDWRPAVSEEVPETGGIIDQDFYLEKADAAFNEENFERALTFYSRALQYDVNIERAWLGQIRCLTNLNELQEAIIWSDRAFERFPRSGGILAARAVAESRLGRMQPAMGFADNSLSCGSDSPYVWIARGEVLISTNPTNAKACFAKALEITSQDWAVRMDIARSYIYRGHYHEALEQLRTAVRLQPEAFTAWYWIGKCAEALGDTGEARTAYRRAMASQPAFTRARKALEELDNRGPFYGVMRSIKRIFHKR